MMTFGTRLVTWGEVSRFPEELLSPSGTVPNTYLTGKVYDSYVKMGK